MNPASDIFNVLLDE